MSESRSCSQRDSLPSQAMEQDGSASLFGQHTLLRLWFKLCGEPCIIACSMFVFGKFCAVLFSPTFCKAGLQQDWHSRTSGAGMHTDS